MAIKFSVLGVPVAKGRPRATVRGKYVMFYTPKETREAEDSFVAQSSKYKPAVPLDEPLLLEVKFYKPKPKSKPKKIIHWTTKPDLDNLIKLVKDAMNGIFYRDDSVVVEIVAGKYYDDIARTEITLSKI